MSDRSGLGNKGEKNQSKFKGIDINNIFKGTSVTQQKSTTGVRNQQHGLQSLGKVASVRRMPPPANLPSLKSEAGGSDPQINLLPSNSAGWKEETNVEGGCGSPPKSLQQLPATGPSLEQNARRQTPTDGVQQQGHGGSNTGAPLWSSITSGAGRQEGFLDQNSPHFQEEFPQLAAGLDGKIQTSKKEEESKELQYGPGPNLRPQNVANWRDGGGSGAAQQQSPTSFQPPQPPLQPSPGPADGAAHEGGKPRVPPPHLMMPGPMRPSMGGMHPPPPLAHMGQVPMMSHPSRGMIPPFAFHPGFQPHFPPNFMHPGMQRPPLMNSDFRFRGMPPHMVPPLMRPHEAGEESSGNGRPPVVKDCDLEQFDRLELSGGGWAQPTPDVDYTERLVFSDEEDSGANAGSDGVKLARSTSEIERDLRKSSDTDKEDRQSISRNREHDKRSESSRDLSDRHLQSGDARSSASPGMIRQQELWMSQPNVPYIRSPQPMDQRPMPAGAMGYHPMAAFGPRPAFHPPPPPRMGGVQRGGMDGDDEEVWRQRRKQSEDMAVAIERARQRRLEEERRMKEEQVAGTTEKLRQTCERPGRKEDMEKTGRDSTSENSEGREGSSGQENGDRVSHGEGRSSAASTASSGRTSTRLPPRLQKCPSAHCTDEPGSQMDKDADVPALDLELTSSSSSLDQLHQVHRSSPMGHAQNQRQPGSPHGCLLPPHSLHDVPRMPGMGYWPHDPRWGQFVLDPRMGPRLPFDPVTGLPMHMSMSWAVKEKDGGGSEADQRSPKCYYNRHAWPVQGAEELTMRGPGMNPPCYGYPMEMDQRTYMDRLDKRDRSQIMSGGHGGFREESEPRDGDDVSTDGEPLSRGQRDYRSSVSDANCSKDCDEKVKNHGSSTSRNSDRGLSLSSRRNPPSTKRNAPKLEPTDKSVVHAKEPVNKQDSGMNDAENSSRIESDNVRKGGTNDGRRSKQEKQMRNSERRKIEKQFEHSYRSKNDSGQHRDKEMSSSDLRPNEHRSSCPPPISAQQAQQNSPVNSGFMSLRRTHQSASNNSLNSSERKTDSPGTGARSNVMGASQKSMSRESVKSITELEVKEQAIETGTGNRSEKGITEKINQNVPNSSSSRDDNKGTAQSSSLIPALMDNIELPEKCANKPSGRKPKDGSKRSNSRRKPDHRDPERAGRTGQGSREFVRGGRGKAYGYGRWRGGGSREVGVGYNENYEDQYDVDQERIYESGYIDVDLKSQGLEDASGTVVAGSGNRPQADGRWQSNQSRSAAKSSGSKNRERPRGQRGAWHANEGPFQEEGSLGNVGRQKPSRQQTGGKEAGTVAAGASALGDADLGKDEVRLEQNSAGTSIKHLDSVPRKESLRKDEGGQGSNRNQYRKGRDGGNNGGEVGGRAGGGRGYPDQPSSGRDRQGPMEEGQQPRRNQEDNRMGNSSNRPMENIRYDRNGPMPPRFANNDGRRGGSYSCGDRRRRGGGGQGPGRANHQGNRSSKDQSNKKTPASEFNEEWETASEGSDNLSRGFHAKKDLNCNVAPSPAGEKAESSKKGFSNQRRGTRRRGNRGDPVTSRTPGGPRGNSDHSVRDDGSLQKGSDVPPGSKEGQESMDKSNSDKAHGSNGTVHPIYRLDHVVYDDPRLIQRAFTSANRYNRKFMGKTTCEYEKFNDFCQDTMSDITSLWKSDEKEYKGNRFDRNNRNKSRGMKQHPLPPRFAHLLGIKKQQQQLDEDRSQCDSEDWFPHGLCHPSVTASSLSLAVDVHVRHDSGVDMSEPPNSLVSSCRSSPCNGDDIFHCTLNSSSYLDFSFDDDFKCVAESRPAEDNVASFDRGPTVEADLKHYMSKAADSLGTKITSVRTVWNPELSQNFGEEDEQFASDKMRLAALSEHLHGQSTGDWKFEQKDAGAKQPQSCDGGSNSGKTQSCCSSQNLESLSSRKALMPRVMSADSLSLHEYCSSCLFKSSLSSEVWMKNPTEFADESGKTGFVLPHKFGPLISVVLRPETTNEDAFTRGPEMSVRSGIIGSTRGNLQRDVADHDRNVLSPTEQHHGNGAVSTSQVGSFFVANSNESSQADGIISNNPPAMSYFSRVGEEDGQDVGRTQALDDAITVLGKKKNSEAEGRDKSETD